MTTRDSYPGDSKVLMLNGNSAIQCFAETGNGGTATFLEENILLFVRKGTFRFSYGKTPYAIEKDKMVFLRKNILLQYPAGCHSDCSGRVEYICIHLNHDLIKEFMKLTKLSINRQEDASPVIVNTIDQRVSGFIDSLEPYFCEPERVEGNLIKIKLLELLFNLASANDTILVQLLDLREQFRTDITAAVEDNIMNSMSLNQLDVKSGRSLSSFRRDFQSIYNMPPSQWIREKRLEKARELLQSTTMTITDVCYTLGFENLAHFSRLFKSRFGHSPSGFKHKAPVV